MVMNADSPRNEQGLSTRHLILVFLAGVAVCGVFFSLGFLVGYNERSVRMAPVTESVANPATIPPTINTPLETTPIGPSGAARSTTSVPPPVAAMQTSAPASPPGEPTPVTPPQPSPAETERQPEPGANATHAAATGGVGAGITIQVAASRAKRDAEALVRILKGRGYSVSLITPEYAHANDHLYRVQIGPFKSKEEAEKVRTKLTREGFRPFIKH
jgi:cell division septation protein DedD